MDVLKIALLVFLAVAVLTLMVVFVRNVVAKGFPARQSSDHFDQIYFGAGPATPLPDWAKDQDPRA
ncbi:hypothetical protein FHR72_004981 [Mycolicibacterium iranicum]|uniref:Uncharacterized protein n=1 Tax=Mycolicibacterium iranicum TaxID=912594 RepID=A0A839QMU5_MYCIR|nr:hypothetical protein [Mycolicibacterium iranicum]MBB2993471.1 hypothetical protein [Mycolicibacterium iranicum]